MSKPNAYILLRKDHWYRREVFVNGLAAAGYEPLLRQPGRVDKDTVLVIWNRYSENHHIAEEVERGGGRVIVAENGYIGKGGGTPKFQVHPAGPKPDHYYSVTLGYHNDSSRIKVGDGDRFAAIGLELKPWVEPGGFVLVCPNRSFGVNERIMPTDWAEKAAAKARKLLGAEIRIRRHPGNNAPHRALSDDLKGCSLVWVWSSSCGVHALAAGIPVRVDAPYWIMKEAAVQPDGSASERLPHFQRLAWAQWTCQEIDNGEPFRHLLSAAR